jgi:DnaJ-class molecular chaperone
MSTFLGTTSGTASSSTTYQMYATWGMGSYQVYCSRCKGSKKIKVHAPDCTDTACGKNCDREEVCDECKGSGIESKEDPQMVQYMRAV